MYIYGKTNEPSWPPHLYSTALPIMSFLHQNCGRVHEAADLPLKNLVQMWVGVLPSKISCICKWVQPINE